MVNHTSFNQLDTSSDFVAPRPIRLTQTVNLEADPELIEKLRQVIEKSAQYDKLKVVERQGNYLEKYGKTYDTVPEALQ